MPPPDLAITQQQRCACVLDRGHRQGSKHGASQLLDVPAGAPLRLLRKDAGLAFVAGLKSGAGDLPVTAAARALYDRAAAAGMSEKDVMSLLCLLEDLRPK